MTRWAIWTLAAAVLAITASVQSLAQTNRESTWSARTPWGEPDLQGEWTTEGEYGVPLERPAQFGTRPFLSDAEYAKRLDDVRIRDERDLARGQLAAEGRHAVATYAHLVLDGRRVGLQFVEIRPDLALRVRGLEGVAAAAAGARKEFPPG